MRNRTHLIRRIVLWTLALGWLVVLFVLSTQNGEESSELSLSLTHFLLRHLPFLSMTAEEFHPILRKITHFCIFAVEGFLFGLASSDSMSDRPAVALSLIFCAAMAALNEYSQTFAEGRSCELRDMMIDFSGAVLGISVSVLVRWICLRIRRRRQCMTKI